MNITANWIWNNNESIKGYNQTALFRKSFELKDIAEAKIAVSADSYYRLSINGKWINDGPCRSYPEHYQYDLIDVTTELHEGTNTIEVIAKYYGIGTFHQIPQQAGFLAQLEVTDSNNDKITIKTDSSWEAADYTSFIPNTPKISIQQGPFELFNARLKPSVFMSAAVLYKTEDGPWKDLNPRDCRLLNKKPFALQSFLSANLVTQKRWTFSIPAQKILHPGNTKTNGTQSQACGVAFVINSLDTRTIQIHADNLIISVNEQTSYKENDSFKLDKGENLLFCLTLAPFIHDKDQSLTVLNCEGLDFTNPQNPSSSDICFIDFPEFYYNAQDFPHYWANTECHNREAKIKTTFSKLIEQIDSKTKLIELLQDNIKHLPEEMFSQDDAFWSFKTRELIACAPKYIDAPENLIYSSGEMTTINPAVGNDIELVYDLGEQNCGFWEFELFADAGTIIDIFAVEYIAPDGDIQHPRRTRNGMRYICKQGVNRYTSLKRRSGRFLFITIRNQQSAVKFKNLQLIESTYPVEYKGSFECSDYKLNRVWEISARTMKLCMEDTFTDCPLYEQTLWVGDARNESLFAYPVFGAWDLGRRCIKLAGLSLEHYPITGSQVPSGWDCLLPAWSFMWGLSVWDYYFETADKEFLTESWRWVEQNLNGALEFIDPETGLFSIKAWNLFDWSKTVCEHKIMIFNSMFLIGAIDAAVKCAEVLDNSEFIIKVKPIRANLAKAVNRTWNAEKQAFPDSINEQGNFSEDIAVHTSFLSILYNIIDADKFEAAKQNTISPREDMIKVSSPFANLYLYETLEKLGLFDKIISNIQRNYAPMLSLGATTVWETFEKALHTTWKFPTRSHCHGWSAAPLMFLNRITLGIQMVSAGGKAFTISPWIKDLNYATGARATVHGPVTVYWCRHEKNLTINVSAPEAVEINYLYNETHDGIKVIFNGEEISK